MNTPLHSTTLQITVQGFSARQVADDLTTANQTTATFSSIQVKEPKGQGFVITPEAATILISGISSIATLVSALLKYLSSKQSGSIKIVSASGQSIEFPKDTPPERIQYLLGLVQQMEVNRVIVSSEAD